MDGAITIEIEKLWQAAQLLESASRGKVLLPHEQQLAVALAAFFNNELDKFEDAGRQK